MNIKTVSKFFTLLAIMAFAAISARADDTIYSKVDENPLPLKTPPPDYPLEMRRAGISGLVAVMLVIDEEGKVAEAEVAKSSDTAFEGAALAAVKKWRFKPAKIEGNPVKVRVTLPLKFTLDT